jgi:hypothetical protein
MSVELINLLRRQSLTYSCSVIIEEVRCKGIQVTFLSFEKSKFEVKNA